MTVLTSSPLLSFIYFAALISGYQKLGLHADAVSCSSCVQHERSCV
jgi:hypothetical protein